jgi:hypothetical protein
VVVQSGPVGGSRREVGGGGLMPDSHTYADRRAPRPPSPNEVVQRKHRQRHRQQQPPHAEAVLRHHQRAEHHQRVQLEVGRVDGGVEAVGLPPGERLLRRREFWGVRGGCICFSPYLTTSITPTPTIRQARAPHTQQASKSRAPPTSTKWTPVTIRMTKASFMKPYSVSATNPMGVVEMTTPGGWMGAVGGG